MTSSPRPAAICDALLAALDASDGRRRRRKRDTTPDAIGISLKRRLLEEVRDADPEPEGFETWLLERCLAASPQASLGALRAMAREVAAEWRLAASSVEFRSWLLAGAPSDDRFSNEP